LNGARFVACGGGAVAIATMAIKSKAAADVRTGHITNYATGDEPYRSTEKRPGSRSKGHVVYPFSSVSRSRQENRGSDDCGGKKIFHDRTPSLRAGALDQVQVSLRRAHTLNVEVAKEFRSNQKLFPRPVAAHITRQLSRRLDRISRRWRDAQTRGWNVPKLNDDQRRALNALAHQDGCAEAMLLADGFSIDQLAGGWWACRHTTEARSNQRSDEDRGLDADHREGPDAIAD
jgi:hypothetical protein